MEKLTLIDNAYATLWYYPTEKIVHHQIHQFVYGVRLRELLETGAATLEKHGAQKWLSDDRGNAMLGEDDLNWLRPVWLPRIMQAGWSTWAVVLPDQALGQIYMRETTTEIARRGVTVEIFQDPDAAFRWLLAQ